LLRALKVDVVRAYGGKWPVPMAVFFRAKDVPVVVSIHDRRPEMLYPSVRWADVVLCVSEQSRQQVLKYHSLPDRVWLRPNGVDLDRMRPCPLDQWQPLGRKYPFNKVILHVGRKSPEKNIELLIRALKYLPSGTGLVMAGPGDDSRLRQLAEEAGVSSRCVFIEMVPNAELPAFYSWADCFCLPSFDEAMSNVVLEAMACGCPMVLSSAAAAGVGVEDGKEALLVGDMRSAEGLAQLIMRVINDPLLADNLKADARLKAEKFDQKITARMEADQYQLVLEMRDAGLFEQPLMNIAARTIDHCWTRLAKKCSRRQG
jgi:glycosyltransferase involved in cell wall biosynthesis